MVAPITGPTSKTITGPFSQKTITGYKQKRPYDRPLACESSFTQGYDRLESASIWGSYDSGNVRNLSWSPSGNMSDWGRRRQHCYNQAYERIRADVTDEAGWGENLAQFRKSADMVNDRLVQLWRFTNHLRRGRFSQAASTLRIPKPEKVSHTKAMSKNFLEYTYGWAPLFSDIKSSCEILTSDPGSRRVRGKARESWSDVAFSRGSDSNGTWYDRSHQKCDLTITTRAVVRITNPNVFLAARLGLIDPALPWKLLPFSFVVDWFVNVEQILSSMTGWLGVELTHPHYTQFATGFIEVDSLTTYNQVNPWDGSIFTGYNKTTRRIQAVQMSRVLGLPSPELVIRPFEGFNLNRGLQALALVIAVLGK